MVSYIQGLSFALEFDPIGSLVWKLSPVPSAQRLAGQNALTLSQAHMTTDIALVLYPTKLSNGKPVKNP